MSFWSRLFNTSLAAAKRAEATGKIDLAAERYVAAGDRAGAVRMHLARAKRAADRAGEIAALHDALHWASDDEALRAAPAAALGLALLAQVESEGVGTSRDRTRIQRAIELLLAGGEHKTAGDALTRIGDHVGAANAYSQGGFIEAMEASLAVEQDNQTRARDVVHSYASFQSLMQIGHRDEARAELELCVRAANSDPQYRRQLDELDGSLLTSGRVELRARGAPPVVVTAAATVSLGRDVLCALPLRTPGVSRHHAEIIAADSQPWFRLRDLNSRNGTWLGGVAVAGTLQLDGAGQFALGDDAKLDFLTTGSPPTLCVTVVGGLDRGSRVLVGQPGRPIELGALAPGLDLTFVDGRPWLGRTPTTFQLGSQLIAEGRVQLIRGDRLTVDGLDVEVS